MLSLESSGSLINLLGDPVTKDSPLGQLDFEESREEETKACKQASVARGNEGISGGCAAQQEALEEPLGIKPALYSFPL